MSSRDDVADGGSGAEEDTEDGATETVEREKVAFAAVVVTLHVGVHCLGPSCCWSGTATDVLLGNL